MRGTLNFLVKISDRVLVLVLFLIMAVLSMVQVINLRENNSQTSQLRKAVTNQREWAEIGALCVLDTSGAINLQKIPYTPENVEKYLSDCFARVSAQRNLSEPTVTTVTIGGR